ncbi:ubiquinone/menaquinone biosynthesis C-methylase UbiE [Bacteroidales bacterium 6E]|nr:ubiquinone/menaquinone biosynthesis C-methylase UbiE [Bacteroidales bacterium 6E]
MKNDIVGKGHALSAQNTPSDLKLVVQEKYGQIARQSLLQQEVSCCGGSSCCSDLEISMIGDKYTGVEGYNPEADLGLGCGLPTQYAGISGGDHVLDLGSGAGNDCFIARSIVGDSGWITGLDFTPDMVEKARANNQKMGYTNVEFIQGDIEEMPLPEDRYNVVVSNCVLNLVPDKQKAFAEIMRVLKPGGHFCVSDVVTRGDLPEALRKDAEMYAGCVAGATDMQEYLHIITEAGFENVVVHKQKVIEIPEQVLGSYLAPEEAAGFRNGTTGIFSITVSAHKPH